MQACLENALPLTVPASSPVIAPDRLSLHESNPTWTIRFSRPATPDRNELAGELRGVPKAALRQVFGKILGTRLWHLNRLISVGPARNGAANPISAKPVAAKALPAPTTPTQAPISDREISAGMLHYLCTEASATLRDRKCLAKSLSLTALHSNGESETVRQSLPLAANDSKVLEAAARAAIAGMRSEKFVSLKLDLTATPARA